MQQGVGLAAFDRQKASRVQYQQVGESILRAHVDELQEQVSAYQNALKVFAKRHGSEIQSSPQFRTAFAKMCQAIGVDPLSATARTSSQPTFWSELVGVSDFYLELAVRVVELCHKTRNENGGFISVSEVKEVLRKHGLVKGTQVERLLSEDDIYRSVKALEPLGPGIEVVKLGNVDTIRSVPKDLNADQTKVFEAAHVLGYVTHSIMRDNFGWEKTRAVTVLDDMLADSLLWIDSQAKELEFWVPNHLAS